MTREVTELLREWRGGSRSALEELTAAVQGELRKIAAAHLRRERPGHTLQPTALIDEAYIRLFGQSNPEWQSRSHFYSFAAHLMRQVLVDHARSRAAAKRGGAQQRVTLTADLAAEESNILLLALDEALERLNELDPRKARVIELRYFAGLSTAEIAAETGISLATVGRELRFAQAWLRKSLEN